MGAKKGLRTWPNSGSIYSEPQQNGYKLGWNVLHGEVDCMNSSSIVL